MRVISNILWIILGGLIIAIGWALIGLVLTLLGTLLPSSLLTYVAAGFLSALAGVVSVARSGVGAPSVGVGDELTVIAAVVIGGTSLAGGVGSVAGAVMGAFIMSALDNGMSMMDVATFWQYIVKGAILLLAVWMDSATKRRT